MEKWTLWRCISCWKWIYIFFSIATVSFPEGIFLVPLHCFWEPWMWLQSAAVWLYQNPTDSWADHAAIEVLHLHCSCTCWVSGYGWLHVLVFPFSSFLAVKTGTLKNSFMHQFFFGWLTLAATSCHGQLTPAQQEVGVPVVQLDLRSMLQCYLMCIKVIDTARRESINASKRAEEELVAPWLLLAS